MTEPRYALITGAGSAEGIGFHTAKLLSVAGTEVVLAGHSDRVHKRRDELVADGRLAHSVSCDLSESSGMERLLDYVSEKVPRLDVVVANHGMTSILTPGVESGESGSTSDLTVAGFESSLRRNLTSVFGVIKSTLPMLYQSNSGRIVVVSSVTGGTMAMAQEVAYAASKAGLEGLVRAIALDEAPRGITVNAVAPGWIATESQNSDEAYQGRATPLGRSGRPEEVASVISWLTRPEASYITGQVLVVDGGNSIREERSLRGGSR